MEITVTEFKKNLDKYLDIVKNEDIIVTENNCLVGIFSSMHKDPHETFIGILNGYSVDETIDAREERIKDRYKEYF